MPFAVAVTCIDSQQRVVHADAKPQSLPALFALLNTQLLDFDDSTLLEVLDPEFEEWVWLEESNFAELRDGSKLRLSTKEDGGVAPPPGSPQSAAPEPTKVSIRPLSTYMHRVKIDSAMICAWNFGSDAKDAEREKAQDIGFSVRWECGSQEFYIVPYRRIKMPCWPAAESGSCVLGSPGTCVLCFDNGHSWLQAKSIQFAVYTELFQEQVAAKAGRAIATASVSERLTSNNGLVRLQALCRARLARLATVERAMEELGVGLALPGTIQGQSGEYEVMIPDFFKGKPDSSRSRVFECNVGPNHRWSVVGEPCSWRQYQERRRRGRRGGLAQQAAQTQTANARAAEVARQITEAAASPALKTVARTRRATGEGHRAGEADRQAVVETATRTGARSQERVGAGEGTKTERIRAAIRAGGEDGDSTGSSVPSDSDSTGSSVPSEEAAEAEDVSIDTAYRSPSQSSHPRSTSKARSPEHIRAQHQRGLKALEETEEAERRRRTNAMTERMAKRRQRRAAAAAAAAAAEAEAEAEAAGRDTEGEGNKGQQRTEDRPAGPAGPSTTRGARAAAALATSVPAVVPQRSL